MSITAKSVIFDIADDHGSTDFVNLRSVEFWLSGSIITMTSGFTAYSTTMYSSGYDPQYVFDTSTSKIGTPSYTSWISEHYTVTDQRLIIVFDTAISFDQIVVNNGHEFESYTDRGVKNTVITTSTDAITDITYNAAITNSTVIFTGVIPEHVASDVVDDYTVPIVIPGGPSVFLAVLSQPYDLLRVIFTVILKQSYDIRRFVLTILTQPYGSEFLAILTQPYSDKSELLTVLRQYYDSRPELIKILKQGYGDKADIIVILSQIWDLRGELLQVLKQKYSLLSDIPPAVLKQLYDVQLNHEHLVILRQQYSLFEVQTTLTPVVGVTINGSPVEVSSISYDYDIDQYCASFQLVIPEYSDWLLIDYKQEVVISINGLDHHSVVVDMNNSVSATTSTYSVECKSPSVLLDFPFADKVPEDYVVSGLASDVVNYMAGLEGMTISWEMNSNPPLTSATVVAGGSPLAGIRENGSALGGRVQSHPDGSIHAVPRYQVNTNEYSSAVTSITLTTGTDFTVLSTDVDKRYGYNKYSVSDSTSSDGISLRTKAINSHKYEVMASKVPWSTEDYVLETSELTNIVITYKGVTEESVSEEVEIVEGAGSVQYPCYNVISYNYHDRVDLGIPDVAESGSVTTSIKEESILNIEYTTRYHLWEVTDTDTEKVQLILVKP